MARASEFNEGFRALLEYRGLHTSNFAVHADIRLGTCRGWNMHERFGFGPFWVSVSG